MPHSVKIEISTIISDLAKLLSETKAFWDWHCHGQAACQCLLRAACEGSSQRATMDEIKLALESAPLEIAKAFMQLVHGSEAILTEYAHFFSLFELSQRLGATSCKKLCEQIIKDSLHETLPIHLQLAPPQFELILSAIQVGQHSEAECKADGAIEIGCDAVFSKKKISQPEDQCAQELESGHKAAVELFPLHRVILAASSEYFRCLWSSGFSEESCCDPIPFDVAHASSLKALLMIVYGREATLETMTEVVDLFQLADMWQCSSIQAEALIQIKKGMTCTEALNMLQQPKKLHPTPLVQAAADVLTAGLLQDYEDAQNMPSLTASRLLQEEDALCNYQALLAQARQTLFVNMCKEDFESSSLAELDITILASIFPPPQSRIIEITGKSAELISKELTEDKWIISRLNYTNNEEAFIALEGPVTISFTAFATEPTHDYIECHGVKYSSRNIHNKPPDFRIAAGESLTMKWFTDGSTTGKGWSFTAIRKGLPTTVNFPQLSSAILHWVKQRILQDKCTRGSGISPSDVCAMSHPVIKELLHVWHATSKDRSSELLFEACVTHVLVLEGLPLAIELLKARTLLQECGAQFAVVSTQKFFDHIDVASLKRQALQPQEMKMLLYADTHPKLCTKFQSDNFAKWAMEVCGSQPIDAMLCIGYLGRSDPEDNLCAELQLLLIQAIIHCINADANQSHILLVMALNFAFYEGSLNGEGDQSSDTCVEAALFASNRSKVQKWITDKSFTPNHLTSKRLLGKAAVECISDPSMFGAFQQSSIWFRLKPVGVLHAARSILSDPCLMNSSIDRWVKGVNGEFVFKAILAAAPECDAVFHALVEAASKRFLASEHERSLTSMHESFSKTEKELRDEVAELRRQVSSQQHVLLDIKRQIMDSVSATFDSALVNADNLKYESIKEM